ncbi:MAG: YbbR-like domain-containing protein [Muribaculaceae bacterium]|nr:YbbR-like domain-containing protein [Muribaculaceae bacterium]
MQKDFLKSMGQWGRTLRKSSRFRSVLTFAVFVGIAALFWLILTLNDSVQDSCIVNIKISNKPDSVTFISDVPKSIHVEVKDKGSSLMRTMWMKTPTLTLNFRELSDHGQMICSRSDIMSALKETFGSTATILSSSIDSLRLIYTDRPGKSIPVVVLVKAHARAGYIVYGKPMAEPTRVTAYGPREIIDTLTRVMTKSYVEQDLAESKSFESELRTIPGVRLIPGSVHVNVNVEPLVAKEDIVTVVAENVPHEENLLLFPSNVRVSYFVPMSEFSDDRKAVRVVVDYNDLAEHRGERLPLRIETVKGVSAVNPRLHSDSVEYTLVR